VKAWLVKSGIDAARLVTQGFGATKPVADNGTGIGRAQNRRVELARG
jgi:OmpA-OmpF porin, OOP family